MDGRNRMDAAGKCLEKRREIKRKMKEKNGGRVPTLFLFFLFLIANVSSSRGVKVALI